MNKSGNNSLKQEFLFNFLFFSTMPLIIVSFIISIVINYSLIIDNYKKNYILTKILKHDVKEFIDISVKKMRHSESMINNGVIKDINSFLDSIIKNDIIFKSIKIADKNGIIKYMAPYNKDVIGSNIYQTYLFKNLDNNVKWTDVFISFIDYSINVNLIFYSNNYLYIGEINLIYLENIIYHIRIEKNIFPFIVDSNNIFIAHPDKKNVRQRNTFEYINRRGCSSQWNGCFVTIDDKDYLLNFELIEETGWKVGIIKPREELYSGVFRASVIIIIGTLLSFSFALFVSLIRIKAIFKPIELLTLNSKEISIGNYDIEWTNSKYKEIDELSTSFKKMIDVIKNREENLKNSLKEKELYLKEIHHRVKNNLQIINALLNLQKRKLSDESLITIFSETQNRVLSMATVHEELYRSNNLGKINLKNLINSIVNNLFRTYRLDKPVNYKNNLSEVHTIIDISIPLGLIINEIVSNSLKYAFLNRKDGEININLDEKDGKIIIEISDNGVGLKEDFDIEKTDSLGMSLIFNLTNQLNGKITYINKDGLKYLIEIPIK